MNLAEYFLLAFASIFWPLLIAIVVVALRTSRPIPVLTAFLAGGLLTTISVGIALVFTFGQSSFVSGSRHEADPVVSIVAGLLALLAAYVARGFAARPRKPKSAKSSGRTDRIVGSARLAFLAGIVLNIAPGLFPFVALKNVAELDASASTKVLLVVVFYLIMFLTVEIPILGAVVAPARTMSLMQGFNDWLDENGRRLAVWLLALVGVYLVIRGIAAI